MGLRDGARSVGSSVGTVSLDPAQLDAQVGSSQRIPGRRISDGSSVDMIVQTSGDGSETITFQDNAGVTIPMARSDFTQSSASQRVAEGYLTDSVTGAYRRATEVVESGAVAYWDGATQLTVGGNETWAREIQPIFLGRDTSTITGGTPLAINTVAPANSAYSITEIEGGVAVFTVDGSAPDFSTNVGTRATGITLESAAEIAAAQIDEVDSNAGNTITAVSRFWNIRPGN